MGLGPTLRAALPRAIQLHVQVRLRKPDEFRSCAAECPDVQHRRRSVSVHGLVFELERAADILRDRGLHGFGRVQRVLWIRLFWGLTSFGQPQTAASRYLHATECLCGPCLRLHQARASEPDPNARKHVNMVLCGRRCWWLRGARAGDCGLCLLHPQVKAGGRGVLVEGVRECDLLTAGITRIGRSERK